MSADLSDFIEHAREQGMDHATIRMLLLSAGWKEKDVIENICLGDGRHRRYQERQLLRPVPAALEQVVDSAKRLRPDIRDPETGMMYDFTVLDDARFQLCAAFRFARDEELDPVWNHQSGHQCFEFDVTSP